MKKKYQQVLKRLIAENKSQAAEYIKKEKEVRAEYNALAQQQREEFALWQRRALSAEATLQAIDGEEFASTGEAEVNLTEPSNGVLMTLTLF